MKTVFVSCRTFRRTFPRRERWALAFLIAIAPITAPMANSLVDQENVTAVWKAQQVNFEYRGYSTTYSCRSLEDKLTMILRTVGAREDVQLRSYVWTSSSASLAFKCRCNLRWSHRKRTFARSPPTIRKMS